MDINISKTEAFDRWIESLQILAGDEDNPTEEQRGALAVTRRKMLDVHRAAVLREAADEVFSLDFDQQVENDEDLGSVREAWDLGTVHARDKLLRMADGKPEASDG